jgi:hypothetical protein
MEDLEHVLSSIPQGKGKLVTVDGLFSMEGDIADAQRIHYMALIPMNSWIGYWKSWSRLVDRLVSSIEDFNKRAVGEGRNFPL